MNINKQQFKTLLRTGFLHIFGGNALCKIIGFLSTTILVHLLSKTEYGVFTYAWNIYNIALMVSGLGLSSALIQLCSERNGDTDYTIRLFTYGTRNGVLFNFLLGFVLLAIGLFVPLKIPAACKLLCIICMLPIAQLLFEFSLGYLRFQKRNQEFAWASVFNSVAVFIAVNVGALFLREAGVVLGYYLAYISTTFFCFMAFRIRLYKKNAGALSSDEKKELWGIATVSMCTNALSQLMYLLDVFVLGIVAAEETVLASYRVATLIPTALTFIPTSLITYIYPYFAEHRKDGHWCLNLYKKVVRLLGLFNLCVAGALFVLAPWIIPILFGQQYADSVTVFRLLSLNYAVSGTFRILSGNLLVTQRKLKFNLLVAIVSSLTNVIGDFFFIQWWGSIGAALVTMLVVLISSIMSTVYLIYTLKKEK